MLKKCIHCYIEKELEDYRNNKAFKDGHENVCRQCRKTERKSNIDKIKKYNEKYYEKNKEKILIRKASLEYKRKHNEYKKKLRKTNIEKYRENSKKNYRTPSGRYSEYKRRAKRSGIDFNLTLEQFISFWQKECFYCGDKIEYVGIDRLDNNLGYMISNCVSCCIICNRMKLSFHIDEWIEHIKRIIDISENGGL